MTAPTLRDWETRTSPVPERELSLTGQVGNPGMMGTVHAVDAQPPCFYKKYEDPEQHAARLEHLVARRRKLSGKDRSLVDTHCAWPIVTVVDDGGQTAGFLMHPAPEEFWAEDSQGRTHILELSQLLLPAKAESMGLPVPDARQRLELLDQLAEIFDVFDRHDLVYGDVSENNVLWTVTPSPRIFLIDCDNARPGGLPARHAGVAMSRSAIWQDPALPADGLSFPDVRSDRFALAMFCYRVYYRADSALSYDGTEPVIQLPPDAPVVPLQRVLPRGLCKNPDVRPPAAEWLRWVAATRVARLRRAGMPAPAPAPASPWSRLWGELRWPLTARSATWIAAIVVVIAAVVILIG